MEPWLQQVQLQIKDTVGKVTKLEAENKSLCVELYLVKGQLFHVKHEIHSEKLVDLTEEACLTT